MTGGHSIVDNRIELPSLEQLSRVLLLEDYNTRVVVLGVMALGTAAGVIGSFLLLRRRALTADALAHATLPGIAIAFMVMIALGGTGKALGGLLLGGFLVGCIGVLVILAIRHTTRLADDAAIGIVLSVFFGLGICLLHLAQEMPGGSAAGLDGFIFGKAASMVRSDAWTMLIAALAVACIAAALVKEFTLLCYDEGYAATQGWPVILLDVILMGLVAAVTVIALQSVGLVLAVALLIIPAAAARYWTTQIIPMVLAAAVIGCACGWLGAILSALIPRMPTGPVIVLVCAFWFIISLLTGPNNGVIVRIARRVRLARRVGMQHLLRAAWECAESREDDAISLEGMLALRSWSAGRVRRLARRGHRRGFLRSDGTDRWSLTGAGMDQARRVVRNHRLWEVYLIEYADIALSHVDHDADRIEHVLGQDLVERLEALLSRGVGEVPASPHALGGDTS